MTDRGDVDVRAPELQQPTEEPPKPRRRSKAGKLLGRPRKPRNVAELFLQILERDAACMAEELRVKQAAALDEERERRRVEARAATTARSPNDRDAKRNRTGARASQSVPPNTEATGAHSLPHDANKRVADPAVAGRPQQE